MLKNVLKIYHCKLLMWKLQDSAGSCSSMQIVYKHILEQQSTKFRTAQMAPNQWIRVDFSSWCQPGGDTQTKL